MAFAEGFHGEAAKKEKGSKALFLAAVAVFGVLFGVHIGDTVNKANIKWGKTHPVNIDEHVKQ